MKTRGGGGVLGCFILHLNHVRNDWGGTIKRDTALHMNLMTLLCCRRPLVAFGFSSIRELGFRGRLRKDQLHAMEV